MTRANIICIVAAVASIIAGCAGFYTEPSSSAPVATLKITANTGLLTNSMVRFFADLSCTVGTEGNGLVDFSWATASEKDIPILAGRQIYLYMTIAGKTGVQYKGPGMDQLESSSCGQALTFAPEPHRIYEVKQDRSYTACAVQIVDTQTGLAPPSLRPLTGAERDTLNANCRKNEQYQIGTTGPSAKAA